MISTLILTKNEETNIAKCIRSIRWSDDIVVYDSFSDDKTVEIAKSEGARVIQRKFDNWSAHQNWGVENIEFKHPWVFYLDADEVCDEELKNEIASGLDDSYSAFRVRRKDFFMGRWLKRSQIYPTWIVRLFRPEKIRYERLVNPVAVVDGETGTLNGHLIHYPFSHGVRHWFERHNNYSDFESQDLLREASEDLKVSDVLSSDQNLRRRAIKKLAYRMPCRPSLIYWYLIIVRMGFLDGKPGRAYASMRAAYEKMIDVKVMEARWRRDQGEEDS